jgi:hypothetical protein
MEAGHGDHPDQPSRNDQIQDKLSEIGVSSNSMYLITRDAALRTEHGFALQHGVSLHAGDYDAQFERNGYPHITPQPTIELATKRVARQGLLRRRIEIPTTETKQLVPIDIGEQVATFAREIIAEQNRPVRIVDFGAGTGVTACKAANLLADKIDAGQVSIIATNYDKELKPFHEVHERDQRTLPPVMPSAVSEAWKNNRIQFEKANILELYDLLQGEKVDLLFIANVLTFTQDYNDAILTIAADMLDPHVGTALIDFGSVFDSSYPVTGSKHKTTNDLIYDGEAHLQHRGFRRRDPLQIAAAQYGGRVTPTSLHDKHIPGVFTIYQADEAPPFSLLKVA